MEDVERLSKVLDRLRQEYQNFHGTALEYDNPLQLLIATILSAQSTDDTVNKIVPKLFERYKTAADFAKADRDELEEIIYSSGYYRNKAKWIQLSCKKLIEDYDSEVPSDIEELTKLPGVGRKTANIVLSNAFDVNQGIAVDTHVMRLTKRLEFSNEKSREKIELGLMELVPRERWDEYTDLLISHGRRVCEARNPNCAECVVKDLCPSAFTFD